MGNKIYLKQYLRMSRWYEKFEGINNGTRGDLSSFDCEDEVYAFFVNCYHLFDWLKNSDDITQKQIDDLKTFINDSTEMQICHALCIGAKHYKLKENFKKYTRKYDENTKITRQDVSMVLSSPPTSIHKYHINYRGKDYDAFMVATECKKRWDEFLDHQNLR